MGTQKGYSWKTNQYGLTIDTVESFKLVLPDGTFQVVTSLNEDLWFGLRVCYTIPPLFPYHTLKLALRVASTTLYADHYWTFLDLDLSFFQGIVTSFVLKAHPQGLVWVIIFCFRLHPSSQMNERAGSPSFRAYSSTNSTRQLSNSSK